MTEIEETTVEIEGVRLTNCFFKCPKCQDLKGAAHFGLRVMPDGKVRNQSYCTLCRSLPVTRKNVDLDKENERPERT